MIDAVLCNDYGFINQKGNRWFIKVGATTRFNSGFRSIKQFSSWLINEFKKHGLDWQSNHYTWKYLDNQNVFELVNGLGREPRT